MKNQEIEAKYYVQNLALIAERLKHAGAQVIQGRVFERNLRFDTHTGELRQQGCVLRLRQDNQTSLTYKGASHRDGGVLSRMEVEFAVSDFGAAQTLLEALGYVISAIYEKYRTTFQLGQFHIMLDELPYGNFVEIEGPDPDSVQRLARDLGLDPAKAAGISYLAIFERLCQVRNMDPSRLTFSALQGVHVRPQDLNLEAADR